MKLVLCLVGFTFFNLTSSAQVSPIAEDFSDNKRAWLVDEESKIQNGVYILTAAEAGSQTTINFYLNEKADFEIAVDLTQKAGSDQSVFGLVWNSGLESYNAFLISAAGEYIVVNGSLDQLKGWKKTKTIREGTNKLRIQRTTGKEIFLINDTKVDERKLAPFFGQWAGVLALNQVKLEIDNFYFKQEQSPIKDDKNFSAFKKENLGDRVNSSQDDLGPIISTDGKTIYFSRQNVEGNVGGNDDGEDIWYSSLEKGLWGFARNMGKPINSPSPDNLVAVGSDNNTMLFKLPDGLAFRYRTSNGWSELERMDIAIESESSHFVGNLSTDSRTLVFSAMRKGNLYYDSRREDIALNI